MVRGVRRSNERSYILGKQYGKWEIVSDLDEGGQGWVFVVREKDSNSDEQFILKRLKNPKRLDRFKAEIESLQKLDHPSIVKLVDFDIEDKNAWFVQEYYSGGNLEQYVRNKGPLDYDEALDLLISTASALEYAHSLGNIHRDIKPANIFLRGKDGLSVLGDFGLAWSDDAGERVTLTDEAVGSFHYIAPELANGRAEPTRQCDIYSLGKVLYFMLSGGRMFNREIHREPDWNLVEISRDIRLEHINNLLDHMLTIKPVDRYSASDVRKEASEIKRLIEGEYAPLEGHIRTTRCKFCGRGYYQTIVHSDEGYMHFFGFSSSAIQGGGRGWRVMVCDICGHVEFFRMDGARNKWWPDKK
jgi:serine/threonine protein kinase